MGAIVYRPHCEKCGALINQEIQLKRFVYETGNLHLPTSYYEFTPFRCKHCGEVFDSAIFRQPEETTEFLTMKEGDD